MSIINKGSRRLIVVGAVEKGWTRDQKYIVVKNLVDNIPNIKKSFDVTGSGRSDQGGVDIWFEKLMQIFAEISFKAFPPIGEKPQCYYTRNQKMADWGTEFWGFLPENKSLKKSGTMQTIRKADKQGKKTRVYIVSSTGFFETEDRGFYIKNPSLQQRMKEE